MVVPEKHPNMEGLLKKTWVMPSRGKKEAEAAGLFCFICTAPTINFVCKKASKEKGIPSRTFIQVLLKSKMVTVRSCAWDLVGELI